RSIRIVLAATWYCARAIAAVARSACAAVPGSARKPVKKYGCTAGPASVIPPEVARDSSSRNSTEGVAYRYARVTDPVRLIAGCYRPRAACARTYVRKYSGRPSGLRISPRGVVSWATFAEDEV